MPLNIAIDHDTTYAENPVFWRRLATLAGDAGHAVHLVSLLPEPVGVTDLAQRVMPLSSNGRVVHTNGVGTRCYMQSALGVDVDIFVDARPEWIVRDYEGPALGAPSAPACKPLAIALDYDDTYTADPVLWDAFVRSAFAAGHEVFIVTLRAPVIWGCVDTASFYPPLAERVVYTHGMGKRKYMQRVHNIAVDVFIDDRPDWIVKDHNLPWPPPARDSVKGPPLYPLPTQDAPAVPPVKDENADRALDAREDGPAASFG